jgi:uncharacterized protein YfaA (DUF2138 family)
MTRMGIAALLTACWTFIPADASACVCVSSSTEASRSELTRQVRQELNRALVVFVGGSTVLLTVRQSGAWFDVQLWVAIETHS